MWTDDPPTEPGWYWLYGWPWGQAGPDDPRQLRLIHVQRGGRNLEMNCCGRFVYPSQAVGQWARIAPPEVPE